jgi:pyruvate dehydrogenase E2 component (dihydrolipoamide acetyltransferase)
MSATANRVTVPDIGDFSDVPIIEILVGVGDTVAAEDPLVTLESDKATMDVPAPFAGTVKEILVSVDDKVAEGSELMVIEPSDGGASDGDSPTGDSPPDQTSAEDASSAAQTEDAPATPAAAPAETSVSETAAPAAPAQQPATEDTPGRAAASPSTGNGGGPIYASPSARRLARELRIDISALRGSGRGGRITRDDVRHAADAPAPPPSAAATTGGAPASAAAGLDLLPWPTVDFEKFGPVQRVQRSRIQRISAPNLARNWVMIPHVTHDDEADITELEDWRKLLNSQHEREGVKFTMVSFLVKASVVALKQFEIFNASLDGDELVLKRYYNIGFAADTPNGLVVPVIKDADKKGLKEIAQDLTELSGRAREGKLQPSDMSGATFTISSLGGIGGTSFTPIINAPEVAILGVTRAAMKPLWDPASSTFTPRLMVPLSLSYDHRVIDGAAAARFMVFLVGVLSDLRRALL